MKKIILFLMLLMTTLSCLAYNRYYDHNTGLGEVKARHGLEVKRLRNWAPKYLTVIDNHANLHFENAPNSLRFLSVITAINGNSTEFMDENEFYRSIDVSFFLPNDIFYDLKIDDKTIKCREWKFPPFNNTDYYFIDPENCR